MNARAALAAATNLCPHEPRFPARRIERWLAREVGLRAPGHWQEARHDGAAPRRARAEDTRLNAEAGRR